MGAVPGVDLSCLQDCLGWSVFPWQETSSVPGSLAWPFQGGPASAESCWPLKAPFPAASPALALRQGLKQTLPLAGGSLTEGSYHGRAGCQRTWRVCNSGLQAKAQWLFLQLSTVPNGAPCAAACSAPLSNWGMRYSWPKPCRQPKSLCIGAVPGCGCLCQERGLRVCQSLRRTVFLRSNRPQLKEASGHVGVCVSYCVIVCPTLCERMFSSLLCSWLPALPPMAGSSACQVRAASRVWKTRS